MTKVFWYRIASQHLVFVIVLLFSCQSASAKSYDGPALSRVTYNENGVTLTVYEDVHKIKASSTGVFEIVDLKTNLWGNVPSIGDGTGERSITISDPGTYKVSYIKGKFLTQTKVITRLVHLPTPLPDNAAEIAAQYMPVLVYNKAESTFPMSAKQLFDHSSVRGTTFTMRTDRGTMDVDADKLDSFFDGYSSIRNPLDSFFGASFTFDEKLFRLSDGLLYGPSSWGSEQNCSTSSVGCREHPMRENTGSPEAATVYWDMELNGNSLYLTYHFLYSFDSKEGTNQKPGAAAHIFDRESMTLQLQKSIGGWTPTLVVYSGHKPSHKMGLLETGFDVEDDKVNGADDPIISALWEGGRVSVSWADALKVGSHPVAYIASGSHAVFPIHGTYSVFVDIKVKEFIGIEEAGSTGKSKLTLPSASTVSLVRLTPESEALFRFDGWVVNHFDYILNLASTARFPPFVLSQHPRYKWAQQAPQFRRSCVIFNAESCNQILANRSSIQGLDGIVAYTVSAFDIENNALVNHDVEVYQRAGANVPVFTGKTTMQGTYTFFDQSGVLDFDLYIDGRLCAYTDENISLVQSTNSDNAFKEYALSCQYFTETEEIPADTEEQAVSEESDDVPDENSESEPTSEENDNLEPASDNPSTGFSVVYPTLATESDRNRRNSIAWYAANPTAKLHTAECITRPDFTEEWANGIEDWTYVGKVLFDDYGIAYTENMQQSIQACGRIQLFVSATRTYEESIVFQRENFGDGDEFLDSPVVEEPVVPDTTYNPDSLIYPEVGTKTDPNIRNSLAWYLANPQEQLYVAECQVRPESTLAGSNILNWFDSAVNIGRRGMDRDSLLWDSIIACSTVMYRVSSGMSFDDAALESVCEEDQLYFADSLELKSRCSEPVENDETSPSITITAPLPETEDNPAIRNSVAWYRANSNRKLFSQECLTRIDKEGIAGWTSVAIAVQVNGGISQESNMWKSISACSAVPFWLNANVSFADTIANIQCQPGPVFADSTGCS